jgi:hypothetical protein
MADDEFTKTMLLNLDSKVTEGFSEVNKTLAKHGELLAKHHVLLEVHTNEDTTAQRRVDRLEAEVHTIAKPVHWVLMTGKVILFVGGAASLIYTALQILGLRG